MKKSIENITNHAEVSEKAIEKYLYERTKEIGLLCLKYSNPNAVGYPDRIILMPFSGIIWVELKSKGKKPTKLQQIRHAELKAAGHEVYTIDSKDGVDDLINKIEWLTRKEDDQ